MNNLEAMSQWKTFSQQRAPFHLYVPVSSIDTARRMATDLQIPVAEIWAYSAFGDQMRFTLVHRSAVAEVKPKPAAPAEPKPRPAAAAKTVATARPVATPTRAAASPARAGGPNGRARGVRPAPTTPPARRPAPTAKTPRKAAAPARGGAKAPAPRRAAAKKPASRAQKRK